MLQGITAKLSFYSLPHFVAFIMIVILHSEESEIEFWEFLRLKQINFNSPLCMIFSISRSCNLRNLSLKRKLSIPQIENYYWKFPTLHVFEYNQILWSEEFELKMASFSDWRLSEKFPTLLVFLAMKSCNMRNQDFILSRINPIINFWYSRNFSSFLSI